MRKFVLSIMVLGLVTSSFGQVVKEEKLSEVVVTAVNYKYVSQAGAKDMALPVKLLERKVANYDLKSSELYSDEYDFYTISFYIPDGRIVAAYDKDGKIIRTIEKFKDVKLPTAVRESVAKRFPGWVINKDVYQVSYHEEKGATKKYKIRLENGDKRLRVKTDEEGNFL